MDADARRGAPGGVGGVRAGVGQAAGNCKTCAVSSKKRAHSQPLNRCTYTRSDVRAKVVHIDVQSFIRGLKGEYFKSRVSSLVHLVTVVTRALPCSIPRSRPHRAAGTPCPARAGRRPAAACEAASTPLRTFTEPVRVGPVRNRQWPVNAIPGVPSRSAQGTSLNPWGPARCGPYMRAPCVWFPSGKPVSQSQSRFTAYKPQRKTGTRNCGFIKKEFK